MADKRKYSKDGPFKSICEKREVGGGFKQLPDESLVVHKVNSGKPSIRN
jgi:hypothetical protein